MAAELEIFSIYRIPETDKYYILKTTRPDFNNASQNQDDDAVDIETTNRDKLLSIIMQKYKNVNPLLIGELQGLPVGEELYGAGNVALNIYYMETDFGHPWIVMGTADNEQEFLSELNDNEELMALIPIGKPKQIIAWYLTEQNM